jgi:hypothetical protein
MSAEIEIIGFDMHMKGSQPHECWTIYTVDDKVKIESDNGYDNGCNCLSLNQDELKQVIAFLQSKVK